MHVSRVFAVASIAVLLTSTNAEAAAYGGTFSGLMLVSPYTIASVDLDHGVDGGKSFLRHHANEIHCDEMEDEERIKRLLSHSSLESFSRHAENMTLSSLHKSSVERLFWKLARKYSPKVVPIPAEFSNFRQRYGSWYYKLYGL
ncbi:uncharacterized protein PITG_13453 [Phytophthora infestans T30-4]|uniref:Secreted RxLR effector peptide protein n=1 Tax=Phytophthora infestans (strain T30-4) TaxID=403677 RepID=D0NM16_PHYIT|nr:uncharacterized protein PITG_13453 [Phytophthora infestans T30-4]EEY60737.1 hypothetical protein PITG_13453 [Phytophthora infestans T30-4]|eukprot:XP_002899683.1 hypothetical protein PITG_13453 [Phytophthora infestans T30-4]